MAEPQPIPDANAMVSQTPDVPAFERRAAVKDAATNMPTSTRSADQMWAKAAARINEIAAN